jgi:hypothetical protein
MSAGNTWDRVEGLFDQALMGDFLQAPMLDFTGQMFGPGVRLFQPLLASRSQTSWG